MPLIAALCLLQIAAGASPARAQGARASTSGAQADSLTYKQLAQKGAEAFAAKDFATAADAFQRAYDLNPVANLLYNIGRALEMQGRFKEANAAYTRFVVQPNVELKARQDALQRIETLQKVIALQAAGGDIDTEAVEKEQGEHQLASMEELKAETAKLKESFSDESAKSPDASAQPNVQPNAQPDPAATPAIPAERAPAPVQPPAPQPAEAPVRADYTLAYVFGGASVATFAASGVFVYLSSAQLDEAGAAKTLSGRREALDSAETYALVADGLLVGGVLLAGAGVYYWLIAPDSARANQAALERAPTGTSTVLVAPVLSPDRAGLIFTMGF